ncbi:MAG: helix-turn-helix transcriptional regulator [Anaerolineae bacterium]
MPRGRRRGRRGPGRDIYLRRTKSFVQPSLLLLLQREEGHGYGLVEGLKELGLADDSLNASVVYRGLREMEHWGWVTSQWDTEGSGPPRRVYRITSEGEGFLEEWASELHEMKNTLERFLEAYEEGQGGEGRG